MSKMVSWCGLLVFCCWSPGVLSAEPTATKPRYRIAYSTYLGGKLSDQLRELHVYPDGSVLVGGQGHSLTMPTTPGVVQPEYASNGSDLLHDGRHGADCYLARLSPDGSKILAATYFGGTHQERCIDGMELDGAGNVVITSSTRSKDLPTTPGCFQPKHGGGMDRFAAKISADLKRLAWCTYVGGNGDEMPRGGLALDEEDNVYLVGGTSSTDFPTTPGAFQTRRKGPNDAATVKLNADASRLLYGTLLGGSGMAGSLEVRLGEAQANRVDHAEFLELVLQDELAVRQDRLIARRTKAASFREQKTLEDFDWDFNRSIKKKQIFDLAAGGFVRQRRDVLLCGPPGVGKSHLAQAIGLRLVQTGWTVLYRSIFDAVRDMLHDEAFEGHDKIMARYLKADLLILDDMGMKQLPKRSGEYLFEILMRRHELKSTMMTSNRPLEDWGKLIGDVPAATALLDRILQSAEIVQITGKRYRLKGHAQPSKQKPAKDAEA